VRHVREELGSLAWIFHAAATSLPGAVARRSPRELEDCVLLNVAAPLDLTAQLQPELMAAHGTVVLIGSAAGFAPQPYFATYSATKAALCALAEALRYELEPHGVRVALVVPPVSATAMIDGMAEASGIRSFPRAEPMDSGERVVRAVMSGRRLWFGAWSDRLLANAHRWTPGVVRALLRSQRSRFEQMSRVQEERRS
jgi:short-subunit dehydrogenase